MIEGSRVVPASDYIDAVPARDVIVKPWPCKTCSYFDHCKISGAECQAWRDYNSSRLDCGPWRDEDRVPFDLSGKAKLIRQEGNVEHNGHLFVSGSLNEMVYLIIGELGVATSADIARELTRRGIQFSSPTLKSNVRRMCSRGMLKKLYRCMWSWI